MSFSAGVEYGDSSDDEYIKSIVTKEKEDDSILELPDLDQQYESTSTDRKQATVALVKKEIKQAKDESDDVVCLSSDDESTKAKSSGWNRLSPINVKAERKFDQASLVSIKTDEDDNESDDDENYSHHEKEEDEYEEEEEEEVDHHVDPPAMTIHDLNLHNARLMRGKNLAMDNRNESFEDQLTDISKHIIKTLEDKPSDTQVYDQQMVMPRGLKCQLLAHQ